MLLAVLIGARLAVAQDCGLETCTPVQTETPTPSITPTPTVTPTPTPDVRAVWTLPAPDATMVGTPGTPVPGQAVAFTYEVNAGQFMIALLLAMILVSLWVFFLVWRTRER